MRDLVDEFYDAIHDPTWGKERDVTHAPEELHRITWTHPKREMVEVLCKRHETELLKALGVLGIGCEGEKARGYAACMRCTIEVSGQEPRFAYGLVGRS